MTLDSVSRRVMVVDDEKLIADTMAMILNSRGHQTKVAYSAELAIDAIPDFRPEIVISDVVMPRMTGVDLAIYLAKHYPECKVMLISGNTATADLIANLPAGLEIPLFAKPVHPTVILDFVSSCV